MEQQTEILQMVAHLNAAISNTRLYAAEHPQVVRNLESAHQEMRRLLGERQPELTLIILDDEVLVDHRALTGRTPQLDQLAQWLRQAAIERITFSDQITLAELARFVKELAGAEHEVVHSAEGIKLGKVNIQQTQPLAQQAETFSLETKQRLQALDLVRDRSQDELKSLFHDIHQSKQISAKGIAEIVQGFLNGMLSNVNPLHMLASLKSSDEYTFTHAINVCLLTMAQAESLGIRDAPLYDIGIAGALHDAGKMFVPDDILNKPGKLTDDEWIHMRDHSLGGAQYLLRLEGLPRLVFLGALEHHICYDGSGYPDLGSQWRPCLVSQMIAIADLFDAMRSRRPYKEPKPDDLILKILQQERGTTYNPVLVDNFMRLIKM
jgi:HD-GYP domain-containing protein (c-di-GMP phosphodiesterase class II)